ADWGQDDTIVLGTGSEGLIRMPDTGGAPDVPTTPDPGQGDNTHRSPQFLPGGHAVLYTIGTGPTYDAARIAVLDLKKHTSRVLVKAGYGGRYVPTGHLVYVRGRVLYAVPFDTERMEVTGSERPVLEGVRAYTATGLAEYSFSDA